MSDRPQVWRIRDAATFEALARTPHRAKAGPLSVRWVPGPATEPPRVAFAVGRRAGSAVVRNRIRRRLRAALATVELAPGAYLVGAGAQAAVLPFADLEALLNRAMSRLSSPQEHET